MALLVGVGKCGRGEGGGQTEMFLMMAQQQVCHAAQQGARAVLGGRGTRRAGPHRQRLDRWVCVCGGGASGLSSQRSAKRDERHQHHHRPAGGGAASGRRRGRRGGGGLCGGL